MQRSPTMKPPIQQILKPLGFDAQPIREGLAVVFGEMASSNYSGIGISCGSGLCNVCLAVLSVPVIHFAIPKAGDFIDTQAAAVTGELATRMRVQKELNFVVNGFSSDRVQNALTVYYDDMIQTLANTLRSTISSSQRLPKLDHSVPIVLSGGQRFRRLLESLHHRVADGRFPSKDFGNPRGRGPAQFHRPRRADGRTLLKPGPPSRFFWPAPR